MLLLFDFVVIIIICFEKVQQTKYLCGDDCIAIFIITFFRIEDEKWNLKIPGNLKIIMWIMGNSKNKTCFSHHLVKITGLTNIEHTMFIS